MERMALFVVPVVIAWHVRGSVNYLVIFSAFMIVVEKMVKNELNQ